MSNGEGKRLGHVMMSQKKSPHFNHILYPREIRESIKQTLANLPELSEPSVITDEAFKVDRNMVDMMLIYEEMQTKQLDSK